LTYCYIYSVGLLPATKARLLVENSMIPQINGYYVEVPSAPFYLQEDGEHVLTHAWGRWGFARYQDMDRFGAFLIRSFEVDADPWTPTLPVVWEQRTDSSPPQYVKHPALRIRVAGDRTPSQRTARQLWPALSPRYKFGQRKKRVALHTVVTLYQSLIQ
jgi:hypothetical protein